MKLVLGRQNPTFSVVAVQLRADITYSKATVSVIIDERGLNKYVRDYVNEIDQLTFAVGKGLQTAQQVQDAISSLGLTKPAADSAWPDDELSISVGYIRAFLETLATSDQLLGLQFSKGLFDTVTALESITGLGIETFYEDFQLIEDNADANSGDGLEYADVKPAADPVGTSDQATSAIGKALQDAVTEIETLAAALSKPLSDAVTNDDLLTTAVSKPLSHAYDAVDTVTYVFDAVRAVIDLVTTAEVQLLSIDKPQSDTYEAVDVLTRVYVSYRDYADSASSTEYIASVAVEKLLTEAIIAAESLSLVFDAVRTFADSTLTTDLLASIGIEKLLTDAANAVSSGSLRMTDYADITYFAEDYVGSTRTFS